MWVMEVTGRGREMGGWGVNKEEERGRRERRRRGKREKRRRGV